MNNLIQYPNYSAAILSTYITGDFFPNNEMAIQTFIASNQPNRGIDADMRSVVFYLGSNHENRSTLRIRHKDLDGWYGSIGYFHTWRQYIDHAVATGMLGPAATLSLIDPSKANSTGSSGDYPRDANGYNIGLSAVNTIIVKNFQRNWTGNPAGTGTAGGAGVWSTALNTHINNGYLSPCEEWIANNPSQSQNLSNCDRTHSTICGGC